MLNQRAAAESIVGVGLLIQSRFHDTTGKTTKVYRINILIQIFRILIKIFSHCVPTLIGSSSSRTFSYQQGPNRRVFRHPLVIDSKITQRADDRHRPSSSLELKSICESFIKSLDSANEKSISKSFQTQSSESNMQ